MTLRFSPLDAKFGYKCCHSLFQGGIDLENLELSWKNDLIISFFELQFGNIIENAEYTCFV